MSISRSEVESLPFFSVTRNRATLHRKTASRVVCFDEHFAEVGWRVPLSPLSCLGPATCCHKFPHFALHTFIYCSISGRLWCRPSPAEKINRLNLVPNTARDGDAVQYASNIPCFNCMLLRTYRCVVLRNVVSLRCFVIRSSIRYEDCEIEWSLVVLKGILQVDTPHPSQ